MAEYGATSSVESPTRTGGRWLTPVLWCLGVALQFATPLLRDRVPLSDDLLIGSWLAPWWVFLQVAVLAGVLAIARRSALRWSQAARTAFAVVAALICALAEPNLVTMLANRSSLGADRLSVALAWSTPLFFYVIPAAVVVYAWLRRRSGLTMSRALAIALIIIGIMSFPYILWLTHLWDVFIRNSGGGSVSMSRTLRIFV